jgi:hypothetical protein
MCQRRLRPLQNRFGVDLARQPQLSPRQVENDDVRIVAEVEPITDDHLRGAKNRGNAAQAAASILTAGLDGRRLRGRCSSPLTGQSGLSNRPRLAGFYQLPPPSAPTAYAQLSRRAANSSDPG